MKSPKTFAYVNIQKLKEFAFHYLPKDSPLREVLLSDEDELTTVVFLARLPIWLKLLKMEVK